MAFPVQLQASLGHHINHLADLKQSTIRPLLQLAVKLIEHDYIEEGSLEILANTTNETEDLIDEWFSVILNILKLHLRTPPLSLKPAEFKQTLQDLKLSPECVQDIISVLSGPKRQSMMKNSINKIYFLPSLVTCKWRIDIIISSSFMSKVLEPYILMEWLLSNGKCYVFELSLRQFHQMRHVVAKLLLEIQKLETYSVIKRLA